MKKTALLLSFAVAGFIANAQVTLTGTSYTQNFDGIASGLPTGWLTYSGSSATSIGSISPFISTPALPSWLNSDSTCADEVRAGGFKNYPSADVSSEGDDNCATVPPSYTNRALGVRQVSPTNATHPNLDSGAAFVLELANTTGLTNFNLSFNLQSLDSASPRQTTWMVDYGIGSSPTSFIPASTTGTVTGTWTTGGKLFSNYACTVNFGRNLDNINTPVYIRVVTLQFSSSAAGSGDRASSAIDDYVLSYTASTAGVQTVSSQSDLSLVVIGQPTSDNINLTYNFKEEGAYALNIYDLTGRNIYTEKINATIGSQSINLSGLNLVPGMYIAKMNNGNSSSVARIAVQ